MKDLKVTKKNTMCVCVCVCVYIYIYVCNKYCKIKNIKIKRQFSTCHIVYMMGLYDVYFKSSCCTYILMWRCEKNSIQTKYSEFMLTDICSIIWDYRKVYKQYSEFGQRYIPLSETMGKYSEFMQIEIHSIIWEISIPMFSLCDKNITNDT